MTNPESTDEYEDTEGNRIKIIRKSDTEIEDAAGNTFRRSVADGVDDEGDDTEGNRIKIIR